MNDVTRVIQAFVNLSMHSTKRIRSTLRAVQNPLHFLPPPIPTVNSCSYQALTSLFCQSLPELFKAPIDYLRRGKMGHNLIWP